ncbi:MAG: hypothetical protein JF588_11745 [Caulobacterales bacterium]|nr:hypothetical protein [Caulobacterales bacterium]
MGLVALAVAVAPCAALAQPADLFFERTVISAAGDRCALFPPQVSAALAAAAQQARGAALRAGTDAKALTAMEQDARARGTGVDCKSPELAVAAARVQAAFAGFVHVSRMTYPGDAADWRADRGQGRTPRWNLAQDATFGGDRMTFGLAGREGALALLATADFADGATPYAARLVLRDTGRTTGPYLTLAGKAAPLARKLPPRAATRGFMAEARSTVGPELAPKGARTAAAFRFPATAGQALAELDPREAVAVEFLFPGDQVRTAYVEVGDFAAGRAFLQVAAR